MRKTAHELGLIVPSDITPYDKYVSRRALLTGSVGLAAAQTLGRWGESFGQSSGEHANRDAHAHAAARSQSNSSAAIDSVRSGSVSLFYYATPPAPIIW